MLEKKRRDTIKKNTHIIKCVAEAVLLCGRQCIGLRGDNESPSDNSGNPGNFLAVLRLIAEHDQVLKEHMSAPLRKNATYLSPRIQNDVIEIIGCKIIQEKIVQEIKEAEFFAVMADEVSSHCSEMMPVCIRYVANEGIIREQFIQFSKLHSLTGIALSNLIE